MTSAAPAEAQADGKADNLAPARLVRETLPARSSDKAGGARSPAAGPLDRAFDNNAFLAQIAATGAAVLARAKSTRTPAGSGPPARRLVPVAPGRAGCADCRSRDRHDGRGRHPYRRQLPAPPRPQGAAQGQGCPLSASAQSSTPSGCQVVASAVCVPGPCICSGPLHIQTWPATLRRSSTRYPAASSVIACSA